MNDLKPLGYWSSNKAQNCRNSHGHLLSGEKYKVVKSFTDYDLIKHPIGESWMFMGSCFLPYDEGLSLFVSPDGKHECHIRMRWREEEQGAILDSLEEYIQKT